jgi:hypothetical protein
VRIAATKRARDSVEIEAVAPTEPGVVYPRLIEAYGRCPPADIGGAAGYEVFASAIADPRHPLHETMIEFGDPEFDPAKVDATALAKKPGKTCAIFSAGEKRGRRSARPQSASAPRRAPRRRGQSSLHVLKLFLTKVA